jgi:hypothetical protein
VEHSVAVISCDLFNYDKYVFKVSKLAAKKAIAFFGAKESNSKVSNFKVSNSKVSNSK